jgi:arylsulfatase
MLARLCLLLAAVGAGAGCAPDTAPPPNIVLIVADTLRADHLGVHGYGRDTSPTIDRFARENLWFRRAVSAAPWTSPSIASLFTALYPTAHGTLRSSVRGRVPTDALSREFVTLAERLAASGYATAAITANGWVTRKRGYAQGFDVFLRADGRRAPGLSRMARRQLEQLRGQGRPFFLYLQYMDPHTPHDPPEAMLDRFHPAGAARRPPTTALGRMVDLIARYDADVRTLDDGIAALFASLRELGLYDDAVIAFVSDHGEQFYEHGEYGHGRKLHDEEIHVPLVLKAPGQSGVVDDVVSTIDLAPTLLELAGAPPLEAVQGLSLLTQRAERARRGAFSEGTMRRNHKALVDAKQRKLVLEFPGRAEEIARPDVEAPPVGLFDLTIRGEKPRDALDDPATQAALERQLRDEYARSRELRSRIERSFVPLDADERARLQALGYDTGAP